MKVIIEQWNKFKLLRISNGYCLGYSMGEFLQLPEPIRVHLINEMKS